MARNNQSSNAARRALIHSRQAGVVERSVCRPSVGCGEPSTSPAACSDEIVAPMDCGRTPSARASAVTVEGPSRSSRPNTDCWDRVRSPARDSSRKRRFSWPRRTRSSPARTMTCAALGSVCWVLTVRHSGLYEGKLQRLTSYFRAIES